MSKKVVDLDNELNLLKQDLANMRNAIVDIGNRAQEAGIKAGNRKKLLEIKKTIDQIYKNIK